jgi:hypothetical protein
VFNLNQFKLGRYNNYLSKSAPTIITLCDYLQSVKTNPKPKHLKGTLEYDLIKKQLPAITVNGSFSINPSLDRFMNSTGLIFIEIDGIQNNIEQVKEYWFNQHSFIIAAYTSLSNTGVHFICAINQTLTDKINEQKQVYFKILLQTINGTLFNNELDKNSFKLTQYTVTGSDTNPLVRLDYEPLSIEVKEKEVKQNSNETQKYYSLSTLDSSIFDYEHLTHVEKVRLIIDYYPAIKDRFYWYNIDYGRLDSSIKEHSTVDEEIINKPTYYEYWLKTTLSDSYFEGNTSTKVVTFDEPILTTEILAFIKTNEGNRNNRLLIESPKLLFNNPFIGYHKFCSILFQFNTLLFSKPLLPHEVQNIADYQYKLFITGKMVWNKDHFKLKKVFYSPLTIFEGKEKRQITRKFNNDLKKESNLKAIEKAIKQMVSNGINTTNMAIAESTGLSLRSVERSLSKSMKSDLLERFKKQNKKPAIDALLKSYI